MVCPLPPEGSGLYSPDCLNGGDEVAGESFVFDNLIFEARRMTVALDGVTQRDGPKATAVQVSNGKRIYSQLLEYRRTSWMTRLEAHALQDALEQLHARLKFLGESL